MAITAPVALIEYVGAKGAAHNSWSALAALRILASPLFAGAFFLSALLAPGRVFRLVLFGATVIETLVCGWMALTWFLPLHSH